MQRLGAGFRQARQCGPCRGLPRGKPFGAPAGAYPYPIGTPTLRRGAGGERKAPCSLRRVIPLWGSDAPTPARGQGLQPYGALTLFFRWRKKSVQKKASGTATPGKRLLLPILAAGLAMSRAAWLASLRLPSCALGARLFPPSKWAGLFPSAAYRRSAPAQLAVGKLTPCKLRCFDVAGRFCGVDKWADVLFPQSAVGILTLCGVGSSNVVGGFCGADE